MRNKDIAINSEKLNLSLQQILTPLHMLWVVALILFSSTVLAESEEPIYTFGVVPQFDARGIHAIWRPILDEIQQRTGIKFSLRGSTTIPDFERAYGGNYGG